MFFESLALYHPVVLYLNVRLQVCTLETTTVIPGSLESIQKSMLASACISSSLTFIE